MAFTQTTKNLSRLSVIVSLIDYQSVTINYIQTNHQTHTDTTTHLQTITDKRDMQTRVLVGEK